MKINNLLFFLFLMNASSILGQDEHEHHRNCGQVAYDSIQSIRHERYHEQKKLLEQKINEHLKQKRKSGQSTSGLTVIKIPVVVHVVHNNASLTIGGPFNDNISDAQIYSQIDVLNEDFRRMNSDTTKTPSIYDNIAADTYIEFCLATRDPDGNTTTGITRHYSSRTNFQSNDEDDTYIKSFGYWPSSDYLNIWVTSLAGTLQGYAQFPSNSDLDGLNNNGGYPETDGVVVHHENFGKETGTANGFGDPYKYGRVTTHEVGHWLGLLHTWGDIPSCAGTDHISDTPNNRTFSFDCPSGQVSCGTRDMVENYMDYTDDTCMNLFTNGQRDRMRSLFEIGSSRRSLLYSTGCCAAGYSFLPPFIDGFEYTSITENSWDTVNTDADNTWEITSPGGYGNSSQSVYIENNISNIGSVDYFVSPILDLKNTDTPLLSFDLAYTDDGASNTDSIIISYETNCSDTWAPLITLYGASLITSTAGTPSFVPSSFDWQTFSYELPEIGNLNTVKLRFENHSKGINNLYIDNINLYKTSSTLKMDVWPNPSSNGVVYVDVVFEGEEKVNIQMYDYLGKLVFEDAISPSRSYTYELNTINYPSGLYFVRATVKNKSAVKKVILNDF